MVQLFNLLETADYKRHRLHPLLQNYWLWVQCDEIQIYPHYSVKYCGTAQHLPAPNNKVVDRTWLYIQSCPLFTHV